MEIAPVAAAVAKQAVSKAKLQPVVAPTGGGFRVEDLELSDQPRESGSAVTRLKSSAEPWSASTRRAIDEAEENARCARRRRFPWGAAIFIFLVLLMVLAVIFWFVYRNMLGSMPSRTGVGSNQGQSTALHQDISPHQSMSVVGSGLGNVSSSSTSLNGHGVASNSSDATNNNMTGSAITSNPPPVISNINAASGITIFQTVQATNKPIFHRWFGKRPDAHKWHSGRWFASAVVPGLQAIRVRFPNADSPYAAETPSGDLAGNWNMASESRTLELDVVLKGGAGGLALSNIDQTPVVIHINGENVNITTNQTSLVQQAADDLESLKKMVIDCRTGSKQYVRLQFLDENPAQLQFSSNDSQLILQDGSGNQLSGNLVLELASTNPQSDANVSLGETTTASAVLEVYQTEDQPESHGIQITFQINNGALKCNYSAQLTGLIAHQRSLEKRIKRDRQELENLSGGGNLNDAQEKTLNDLPGEIQVNQTALEETQNKIQLLRSLKGVKLRLEQYPGGPVVAYIDFRP